MDAGANASVLHVLSVASLVGFGAVVAALPAFAVVRDWVLSIGGGPLVSLATATNAHACKLGLEGIVSKRRDLRYRSGRSPDWLKSKNPDAPAVKREAEEDWGR